MPLSDPPPPRLDARPEPRLAELYQQATRPTEWPRPECPPFDILETLARGEAGEASRARDAAKATVDHLVVCSTCARIVTDLRRLDDGSSLDPGLTPVTPVASHPPGRTSLSRAAWALAALLAVGVGLALAYGGGNGSEAIVPMDRGSAERGMIEADEGIPGAEGESAESTAVEPTPSATLDSLPDRFAWPAQRGATGYRVRLTTSGGEVLWRSRWTSDPAIALPGDLAAPDAGLYTWSVELRGPTSAERLGPFLFAID